jgi:hypothetical protein
MFNLLDITLTTRIVVTGWGGVRFFAPVQTDPGAHPATYTMGTRSFPGVKRPERVDDRPPSSSHEFRVGLYICFPARPSWPVLG